MIEAVIFDLDGLLLDSEVYWERARRAYSAQLGCDWTAEDELGVKGNNSPEWAARIKDRCGLREAIPEIVEGVTLRMKSLYAEHVPTLPGAVETVRELAGTYPLGLASSSPPALIEDALTVAGLRACFSAVVSADEVARGKPAPDVFLLTAARLGYPPESIAVFEDSSAGITAAHAAGMWAIAVPNPHYPPTREALTLASLVLPSLLEFRPDMLGTLRP
jgi:HAD superfamily hydrolase (TIGR01509 family)